MEKRMTMRIVQDRFGARVSFAEYGEDPVPAQHNYALTNDQVDQFIEMIYKNLKVLLGDE